MTWPLSPLGATNRVIDAGFCDYALRSCLLGKGIILSIGAGAIFRIF